MPEALFLEKPYSNIQNGENWCWVVAAKLVGEYHLNPHGCMKIDKNEKSDTIVNVAQVAGMRRLYLGCVNGNDTADGYQCKIMQAASGEGLDGNYAGDDECKCRALQYVVTGTADATNITVSTLGHIDDDFLAKNKDIVNNLENNNIAFIGNYRYIHQPDLIHSVVCIPFKDRGIYLYDPWDGFSTFYTSSQLFKTGFLTNRGAGVITWIQYIKS